MPNLPVTINDELSCACNVSKGPRGIQGETGPANTLSIGTVERGEDAGATITGEAPNQILNLVLPKGDKGDTGDEGPQGPQGPQGPAGAGGYWGTIEGDIDDQTDLVQALAVKQNVLTAGQGISIQGDVISSTATGGAWGTITGTLSDQTDLQTALNAKADNFTIGEGLEWQAGRVLTAPDHLPPNVFTADNVTAGTDIEINRIIDPYVLNEDTLACFHLDGDTTNAVSTGVTLSDDFKSHITGYTDPLVNPWYPGKSATIWSSPNSVSWYKLFSEDFDTFGTLGDFTLDFFFAASGANCFFEVKAIGNATDQATYPRIRASYGGWESKYYIQCSADSNTTSNSPSFPFGTYSHIALVRKNQLASIYVNGNLISQAANSLNFKNFAVRMEYENQPAAYLAEMVFSKIAKWDGNFTPPTAPYHQQEGGNQYEIKSTAIEEHATNCLTEVPQHINLELSSGTLTLKAGSKVYIPAGSGIFREVTISNDVTHTNTSGFVGKALICYTESGNYILTPGVDTDSSSGANWTATSQYNMRYNTADNLIKWTTDTGSTWSNDTFSFPLGVVTVDGANGITSIDNVFNTFGYIGSTVFVLPGVKGYIPNGYNADGTLNNTPFETTAVLTTNAGYNNHNEVYSITENAMAVSQYYARQNDKPTTTGTLWYRPLENKMYRVQDDSSVIASNSCLVIETFRDSSGKITTFYPYTVMRMLDYNEYQANSHIIETYHNGTSWYRVWSNGWCEQGGSVGGGSINTVTFLKPFADTNYTVVSTQVFSPGDYATTMQGISNKTSTSVSVDSRYLGAEWYACGYVL